MMHKHRLKVSIRTQLIALVLFVAMFSLLVLAIVTGVYFTSVLTDTRVSKLEVVAELKSAQLQQYVNNLYFQAYQLSEKQSVQQALAVRKAGNTSTSALNEAQLLIQQTLEASTSLAYAELYDLDFVLVVNVTNPDNAANASIDTLDELFILQQKTTPNGPSLPDGLLSNRAYMEGPILDDNNYFISLTLPIYANESILVPQQFLSGYLTVVTDLGAVNNTLFSSAKNSEYSTVNYIMPTHPYNNLTNFTGFSYAFLNENFVDYDIDSVFNISKFAPASDVFRESKDLGSYVDIKNPFGKKVSLGYSSINLGFALWLVTVEQTQSDFEGPITKLIKIMVGLCIGLAAFMCLITFPLAHYGVRPILKLQKATEDITDRRGLKRKKKKKHSHHFQGLHLVKRTESRNHSTSHDRSHSNTNTNTPVGSPNEKNAIGDREKESNNQPHSIPANNISPSAFSSSTGVRHSWCESLQTPSSVESFSNSYTQESIDHHINTPLPSLVNTRGIFVDELTELTEAFNAMTLELDRQYTHLEDRVRARTKELEAAKVQADMARQQAEKANEAKTVFIANISHELRTPLNGILGMTSVAMSETDINKIQQSLELIFRSGELLLHILIQLLTFSKNQLDKSKLQKKNFQVMEVASQIKSIFGKTAKDQNVNLIISLKPDLIRKLILYGDSNRIIQVVMNFVSNSLKFTPENGTVRTLIEVLGEYDEERSSRGNYEKVFVKNLPADTDQYPVKPINADVFADQQHMTSPSDTSSVISTKSGTSIDTLRSSVYIKSLASLYKAPESEVEYFNEDEFMKSYDSEKLESTHKPRKCYNFGNDSNINRSWVLRFSVSDTGTGIEKSLQDKIFEAFVQGDQTLSRSHGGTGLGLSICKQFAKMMHGTLTLHSEPGKGSTFTFTIPLPQIGEIILNDEELEEYSKDEFNEKFNKIKRVTFIDSSEDIPGTPRGDKQKMDLAHSYKSIVSKNSKADLNSCKSEPKPMSIYSLESESSQRKALELLDRDSKIYDKPELITRASTGTAHSYRSKGIESTISESDSVPNDDNDGTLKLLVAEDNSVNQEVVKRMLKLEGINNISLARDGRDAVQFIRECETSGARPFDLVLMDVQMPNMDGLTATKIIRKELGYAGPIVALTAFADISNEKGCLDAGMSGFLSKPIRRNLLRNIIKQFCPRLESPFEADENDKNSTSGSS